MSQAVLDVHAADQILVYLALTDGPSCFTVRELSGHARTAMWLIEQFLPVRFSAEPVGDHFRIQVSNGNPRRDSCLDRRACSKSHIIVCQYAPR